MLDQMVLGLNINKALHFALSKFILDKSEASEICIMKKK